MDIAATGVVAGTAGILSQKSERPVGVPTALAWGMEGLMPKARFFPELASCPTALASNRTTYRSKTEVIIPPAP
jgi:hypothetical protein